MKFESKFGIGEVVVTRQRVRPEEPPGRANIHRDLIGEIIAVVFERGASPAYHVRVISDMSIPSIQTFREWELVGDPTFNQETGEYPPGTED